MNCNHNLGFYVEILNVRSRLFGEQTRMLQELTLLGSGRNLNVNVLTPGYAKNKIAWLYDLKTDKWISHRAELPRVVIRRSGTFSKASLQYLQQDLQLFSSRGILHTLPLKCSNKWLLYKTLSQSQTLQPHLPNTQLVTSAAEVYSIVSKRKDVYVKPLAGAQGICIFRVKSDTRNILEVISERRLVARDTERRTNVFHPATEIMVQKLSGQREFAQFWSTIHLQRCVIQDTVILQKDDLDRPYDFRWLVQSSDSPKIIARVARVGKKGGVTTNIHTGGIAKAADEMFPHHSKAKRQELIEQMDEIALSVVDVLVKQFGPFAEVGIDLAVNTDDKIFVFEVNPTPGRRMLRALSPTVRELSLRELIEYAIRAIRKAEL